MSTTPNSTIDASKLAPEVVIVCIGLDEVSLGLIRPMLRVNQVLRALTFFDPLPKVEEAVNAASLVLLQWDGPSKKAHVLLGNLGALPDKLRDHLYLLVSTTRPVERLSPRAAAALGVSGWIEMPQRHFRIRSLLFDLDPTAMDDVDEMTGELSAEPRRRLSFDPPKERSPNAVAGNIVDAWTLRSKAEAAAKAEVAGPFRDVCVYHPDTAFAVELERLLNRCGVTHVSFAADAEHALQIARQGTDALLLWFDAENQVTPTILEYLAESRHLPRLPVVLVVPGETASARVGTLLGRLFFDAVMTYDRKESTLMATLQAVKATVDDDKSAGGIVERLRRPLRPDVAPEHRRLNTESTLMTLTERLSLIPGKAFWGGAELVPYRLLADQKDEAERLIAQMDAAWPNAFHTVVLRHTIGNRTSDKELRRQNAELFAQTVLARPDARLDRLYRSGVILARWQQPEALAILLEEWSRRPEIARTPELTNLAGRYYQLVGKPHVATACYADAATREPLRPDFVESLAHLCVAQKQYELAYRLFRPVLARREAPWSSRLACVDALIQSKKYKDARPILAKLLEESPDNKDLKALKARLGS